MITPSRAVLRNRLSTITGKRSFLNGSRGIGSNINIRAGGESHPAFITRRTRRGAVARHNEIGPPTPLRRSQPPDLGSCGRRRSAETENRPAVLSASMVETLSEYLAFRRLFRGASIALMRWE